MSSSGDWGPPPAGTDLAENQTESIMSSVISLMVIGSIAVFLRIINRLMPSGAGLGIDDFCVMLALAFSIGTAVCCLISIPYGGGKHLWVVSFDQFTKLWQITYAYVLIYATTVTLTKTSILLFYRRIFGTSWAFWVCMGLVQGYWVAITIAWLVGCRPVSFFWRQFTDPTAEGHCMNTSLFYFVNGICAMLIDVCILMVPIPIVYRLQMPPGQKAVVCAILLLGSFVCVASIIRIIVMDDLIKAADFTWAMAQVFIWSCCEPFIGIVCACLPTYAPMFRRWWKTVNTRRNTSGTPNSADIDSSAFSAGDAKGSGNFRMSNKKREWNRLGDNPRLRNDDEVELTNDISGPQGSVRTKDSDENINYKGTDIVVKKDISWISGPNDEESRR